MSDRPFRQNEPRRNRMVPTALLAIGLSLALAGCGDDKKAEAPASSSAAAAAASVPDAKMNAALLEAGPLGDKVLGKADAPVTIIEYASLTCSHCAHFHEETFPVLKQKYIDTGKVRLIFREFPLDPLATAASMLARCSTDERYFPLVAALYKQQTQWATSEKPLEALLAIARQAGFTQESFDSCLKDQKIYEGLNEVKKRGAEVHGVNSTPTFFINGEIKRGDMPIEDIEKLVDPIVK